MGYSRNGFGTIRLPSGEEISFDRKSAEAINPGARVVFKQVGNRAENVTLERQLTCPADFGAPDELARKGWVLFDKVWKDE